MPPPVLTSARIWGGARAYAEAPGEQVGFGVHPWALHADDRSVIDQLVEPLAGRFTCGGRPA